MHEHIDITNTVRSCMPILARAGSVKDLMCKTHDFKSPVACEAAVPPAICAVCNAARMASSYSPSVSDSENIV
jgi:hypothetical protein